MDLLKDNQGVIWTSPNGQEFNLKTLENEYSIKHIGEVKENPKASTKGSSGKKRVQDSNDTFTDLGIGGKDIPLVCYFIGENHYTKSKEFEKALCLTGKSRLRLMDGDEITVNVLNFSVKRGLVTNKNASIVTVNFHETSKTTYPKSTKSKITQIKNQAEAAKTNIAQTLDDTVKGITSPTRLSNFTTNFSSMLNKVSDGLSVANNVSLNSIMTDILGQSVAGNMFTIASQLGIVMSKAASLANQVKSVSDFELTSGVESAFGQWTSLIDGLVENSSSSSSRTSLSREEIDNLLINDSTASMAIVSLGESLIEKEFETRAEAVEAAKVLKELEQEWTEFVENEIQKITSLEDVIIRDTSLSDIVDTAANEILEQSYKLKVEKTIVLSEDSTVIELAYEYYPEDFEENPDETVKYLITTNGFGDDEFFLIKRGAEVKIYV